MEPDSSQNPKLRYGLIAFASVICASVAGQVATFPNLAPWYAGLIKPSFNPPNWLFGPVWTMLYLLMAVAAWRVLCAPQENTARRKGLRLFFLQLGLNAAWSWMFFAAHNPFLGLINIVPQLLTILATIFTFRGVDKISAWCLVPVALWVAFATTLNFEIWRLNT